MGYRAVDLQVCLVDVRGGSCLGAECARRIHLPGRVAQGAPHRVHDDDAGGFQPIFTLENPRVVDEQHADWAEQAERGGSSLFIIL